jgi:hypothetical protein
LARRASNQPDADGLLRLPYLIRVSDPPTRFERLQLAAARLTRSPVAIMPHKCKTIDEWMKRYAARLTG